MRRSTLVAVLGGAVAVATGAYSVAVNRDVVTDKHVAGVALSRVALGAAAAGVALLVAGLIVTWRERRAEAAYDAEIDDEPAEDEYVWPTIVVRRHGRPRQRPSAQIVTVPPSTWPVPASRHPSMVGNDPTVPENRPAVAGNGWLPDNVQRLPFRG